MDNKVADDIAAGIHGKKRYTKPPGPETATQQVSRCHKNSDSQCNQEHPGDRPNRVEEHRALWV